jgi:biotin carboxyl carrier protein
MMDKFDDMESSKYIRYFMLMFLFILVIFIFVLQLKWAPKYPVTAEIDLFPSLIEVASPTSGMIHQFSKKHGDFIHAGERLMDIEHLTYRMNQAFFQQKEEYLRLQKNKLSHEVSYLLKRYHRLKPLVQQKILTQDYMHQQWSELSTHQLKLRQIQHELVILKHKKISPLQSPTSGKMIYAYIHVDDKVEKGQPLVVIQLPKTHWRAKIDVPIEYRKYLQPQSRFRFKLPSVSKLPRYAIEASMNHILPITQSNIIQVIADIQQTQNQKQPFLSKMKLQGYLIGEQQTIFSWLINM